MSWLIISNYWQAGGGGHAFLHSWSVDDIFMAPGLTNLKNVAMLMIRTGTPIAYTIMYDVNCELCLWSMHNVHC